MAVVIPQVITEDRASGAPIIENSLLFNGTSDGLRNTNVRSASNADATFSLWFKKCVNTSSLKTLINHGASGGSTIAVQIVLYNDYVYVYESGGIDANAARSNRPLRDTNAWYHLLYKRTAGGYGQIYINNIVQSRLSQTTPTIDVFAYDQEIGWANGENRYFNGYISQVHVIDGQALNPDSFGYTDPLTGVWRPKKYEGTYGSMGYYLPFDGSKDIRTDQSGNGRDFDFRDASTNGSLSSNRFMAEATGAFPILKTVNGGKIASGGVRSINTTYNVTVVNVGNNVYYLDGVRYSPGDLPLYRGGTYKFDQSDASNATHPLRFATAEDAAGSTEYTDGVTQSGTPGQAGAYTRITVPHNAPDTLYYYCTNHGGMGGPTTNTTDELVCDPYAWKNIFAVPMVGSLIDLSHVINPEVTALAVTNSDVNSIEPSLHESNFYGSSYYFPNTGYLKQTDNKFQFGTEPFTIEFWVKYFPATRSDGFFTQTSNTAGFSLYMGTDRVYVRWGANPNYNSYLFTPDTEQWYHIAFVREGTGSGQSKLYIDGVSRTPASTYSIPTDFSEGLINIGRFENLGSYEIYGWLQDYRVYKGVAKYTSDFIPATTSSDVLATCPSGSPYGSSTNTNVDGSIYFEDDDSYRGLLVPNSSDMDVEDGDFTYECFFYDDRVNHNTGTRSSTNVYSLFGYSDFLVAPKNTFFVYGVNDTIRIFVYENGSASGNLYEPSIGAYDYRTWNHFAWTRSGSTNRLFINGNEIYSFTNSVNFSTGSDLMIGGRVEGTLPYQGFISNFRMVKGTAIYTKNFIPPSSPLTNISGTGVLCCQSDNAFNTGGLPVLNTNSTGSTVTSGTRFDTFKDNISLALPMNGSNAGTTFTDYHHTIKGSGSAKTVTANADAQTSTAQSKFYGSSGYFDGNDYLSIPGDADFNFGTTEYTIEMWIKTTTNAGFLYYAADNNTGMRLCVGNNGEDNGNNTGKIEFNEQVSNGDSFVQGTTLVNDGEWHHIAVCRAFGASTRLYVDGKLDATGSSGRNIGNTNTVYIGSRSSGTSGFTGYIQDLRVYKKGKYAGDGKQYVVSSPFVEVDTAVSTGGGVVPARNARSCNFNPFSSDDKDSFPAGPSDYATINPLTFSRAVTSKGNLSIRSNGTTHWQTRPATLRASSGKWYWEATQTAEPSGIMFSLANDEFDFNTSDRYPGMGTNGVGGWSIYCNNGNMYRNGVDQVPNTGRQTFEGETYMSCLDLDNKIWWVGVDGVWFQGASVSEIENGDSSNAIDTGTMIDSNYVPAFSQGGTNTDFGWDVNFGQRPFKYNPPKGFRPWNKGNLPIPDKGGIKPTQHFKCISSDDSAKCYAEGQIAIDAAFTPDPTKERAWRDGTLANYVGVITLDQGYVSNSITVVSDAGNTGLQIYYSADGITWANTGTTTHSSGNQSFAGVPLRYIRYGNGGGTWQGDYFRSMGDPNVLLRAQQQIPDGFYWIKDRFATTQHQLYNTIDPTKVEESPGLGTGSYTAPTGGGVAWCWSAPETFTGTSGTTCRKNTEGGFTTVDTGTNIKTSYLHGLGQTPDFMILKNHTAQNIPVYWPNIDSTKLLALDSSGVEQNALANGWFSQAPDSTTVYPGSYLTSAGLVAYHWKEVKGYSKFGRYVGSGDTDGSYIWCGFKPSMVLVKITSNQHWCIWDNTRKITSFADPGSNVLTPSKTEDEASARANDNDIDFLSDGFKLRPGGAGSRSNAAGAIYYYAAWAEIPTNNLFGGNASAQFQE